MNSPEDRLNTTGSVGFRRKNHLALDNANIAQSCLSGQVEDCECQVLLYSILSPPSSVLITFFLPISKFSLNFSSKTKLSCVLQLLLVKTAPNFCISVVN